MSAMVTGQPKGGGPMTKQAVLEQYPSIPRDAELGDFYFLWDDPLFTNASSIDEWELKDPEFIELRRETRLLAIEALCRKIEILQHDLAQEKQFHREGQCREVWTINQFLKALPREE